MMEKAIEQAERGLHAVDTFPGKQVLSFIALAASAAQTRNTDELRIKAQALDWLAGMIDNGDP